MESPQDSGHFLIWNTPLYGEICSQRPAEAQAEIARQIADFVRSGRDDERIEFGRRHVMQNYSIKKTAMLYLDEYRKVLAYK